MDPSIITHIQSLPKEQQFLAKKIVDVLLHINHAFETKIAWGGIAFRIGTNYSCNLVSYKDHMKLMIWRGVLLEDPTGVLKGKGINTRHIRFESNDDLDNGVLSDLLEQQFKLYENGMKDEG